MVERMHARYIEEWLLQANLNASLRKWKKSPTNEAAKNITLDSYLARNQGTILQLKIRGEAFEHTVRKAITMTDLREFGKQQKNFLVFDIGDPEKGIMLRAGRISKSPYIFLDDPVSKRMFASFSPEFVDSISIKD